MIAVHRTLYKNIILLFIFLPRPQSSCSRELLSSPRSQCARGCECNRGCFVLYYLLPPLFLLLLFQFFKKFASKTGRNTISTRYILLLAEKQLAAVGFFFARSPDHFLASLFGVSPRIHGRRKRSTLLCILAPLPSAPFDDDRSSISPSDWLARFHATAFLPTFVPLVPGFGTFTETRPPPLERVLAMAHTNDQKIRSSSAGSISD